MSLDKDRLGSAIWTQLKSMETYSPSITPAQDAHGLAVWTAVADKIISEFTGHAVVVPTSLTSPSGAVTGTGEIT